MKIVTRQFLLLTVTAVLTACNSFGPDALRGTHPLFNDAIIGSMNDQFIQNVVRLHYRDPVFFLDVASVTASMKLDMSGGLDKVRIYSGATEDVSYYRVMQSAASEHQRLLCRGWQA